MARIFSQAEVLDYDIECKAEQMREREVCRSKCRSLEDKVRELQRTGGRSEATELELAQNRTRLEELEEELEQALGDVLGMLKRSNTTFSLVGQSTPLSPRLSLLTINT